VHWCDLNRLDPFKARHLSIFGWLLKCLLRDLDATELIDAMLPREVDSRFLRRQRKKPAMVINKVRQIVASLEEEDCLPVPAHQALETNLQEMNYIVGMCERIKGSCIPPMYTSHASELLVFYLLVLPFALTGSSLSNAVAAVVSSVVAFGMLGLDEISHVLEQPFGLMPLYQQSKNLMMEVSDTVICQAPQLGSSSDGNTQDEKNPEYW